MSNKGTIYLAGPMRGYPNFNFDTFDAYTTWLEAQGWHVISPAELDRIYEGWDRYPPMGWSGSKADYRRLILRDIHAIIENCNAVAFLPGWESSKGARVERAIAEFFDLQIIDLEPSDLGTIDLYHNKL